jgi:hypothetical protein
VRGGEKGICEDRTPPPQFNAAAAIAAERIVRAIAGPLGGAAEGFGVVFVETLALALLFWLGVPDMDGLFWLGVPEGDEGEGATLWTFVAVQR